MITIQEKLYNQMPDEIKACFQELPNPNRDEVVELFPNSKAGKNKEEKGTGGIWNKGTNLPIGPEYGDSGSAARFFYCAKSSKKERNMGCEGLEENVRDENPGFGDIGGASRVFYCPKTSKTDRNEGLDDFEDKVKLTQMRSANGTGDKNFDGGFQDSIQKNTHPTVKPVDLMQYLVKLVTKKGGTVLDPFMGSGSTGKACIRSGYDFIGIEMEKEYMDIAEARIQYEIDNPYDEKTKTRVKVNENVTKFW